MIGVFDSGNGIDVAQKKGSHRFSAVSPFLYNFKNIEGSNTLATSGDVPGL